jgi:hypothetical protein
LSHSFQGYRRAFYSVVRQVGFLERTFVWKFSARLRRQRLCRSRAWRPWKHRQGTLSARSPGLGGGHLKNNNNSLEFGTVKKCFERKDL